MSEKGKIYFISDVHLGARAFNNDREREKKLVRFLSSIENDAKAIYFLGDIFDFWYEYKHIIPKGFTRLFGKLAQLADSGVEMHYFIGNHDIWTGDYFEKEFGMIMHYDAEEMQINGLNFYLAHGHRTGYRSLAVKIMHFFFHSKWVRRIYNLIHPSINYYFGLEWSAHNRKYKHKQEEAKYLGEEKEFLVCFAKEYLKEKPIDFFVFGHRHVMLDLMITKTSRVVYLGDWVTNFSYGVLDGEDFSLEIYEEET